MSIIIAFANQKGGVAKTTSTETTAAALQKRGKRVLVVDMDYQSSLTQAFGFDPIELDEQARSIYWALTLKESRKPITDLIIQGEIDVLPSSDRLAEADYELFLDKWDSSGVLREQLHTVNDSYDVILIDCPPSLSLLTANCLVAAHAVIVPVKTDIRSIYPIALILKLIADVRSRPNPQLDILGILPTMYNKGYLNDDASLQQLIELSSQSYPPIHVFPPVQRSTRFDRAAVEGRSVIAAYPDTPGVDVYYNVADTIIDYATKRLSQ